MIRKHDYISNKIYPTWSCDALNSMIPTWKSTVYVWEIKRGGKCCTAFSTAFPFHNEALVGPKIE